MIDKTKNKWAPEELNGHYSLAFKYCWMWRLRSQTNTNAFLQTTNRRSLKLDTSEEFNYFRKYEAQHWGNIKRAHSSRMVQIQRLYSV